MPTEAPAPRLPHSPRPAAHTIIRAAAALVLALTAMSCVIRVAWLRSAPPRDTSIIIENGRLAWSSRTFGTQSGPAASIFNRQIQLGWDPLPMVSTFTPTAVNIALPPFTFPAAITAFWFTRRRRNSARDRCPRCDYPTQGLTTPACPECGDPHHP